MRLNCFILSALIFLSSLSIAEGVEQPLSPQDHEELELFFADLILKDQFAYTLFGKKAISLAGGFTQTPWENHLLGIDSSSLFWKRWAIWKKTSKNLYFPNYLIIEELFVAVPTIRFVILINKHEFIRAVEQHQELFSKLTGSPFKAKKVLANLEAGNTTLQQSLAFSEELFGILLGYGQGNAHLYAQRQKLNGPLPIPIATLSQPSKEFSTIEDEIADLNAQLQGCSDEDPFLFWIHKVSFAARRNSSETKAICQQYLNDREKISKLYKNGSFYEVSLNQLIK